MTDAVFLFGAGCFIGFSIGAIAGVFAGMYGFFNMLDTSKSLRSYIDD